MKLGEHWKSLDVDAKAALAKRCETSVGYLNLVALGHKQAGFALAISLDKETGGLVTCEESRPDVDWAYLRAKKNASARRSREARPEQA